MLLKVNQSLLMSNLIKHVLFIKGIKRTKQTPQKDGLKRNENWIVKPISFRHKKFIIENKTIIDLIQTIRVKLVCMSSRSKDEALIQVFILCKNLFRSEKE